MKHSLTVSFLFLAITNFSIANAQGNAKEELKKLNKYLKTFDDGYYGQIEIKGGYLIEHFKERNTCKAKMSDIDGGIVQLHYNRVILKCKGGNKCIYSTWNGGAFDDYIQFVTNVDSDKEELAKLLNNVIDSYNGVSNRLVTVIERSAPNTNPNAINKTITYTNGDEYVGYTVNGQREGFGKYTSKKGAYYYEGNWEKDKINGFGTYVKEDGSKYEGNWKDNAKDGKGKQIAQNGNVTQQNWINGKLNGKSTGTVNANGTLQFTIEQNYIDDKETGNPKITYANGDVYEGEWQYGTPYGIGQFTYKNGDIEKGNFWRGKRTGLIELKTQKGKQTIQYYKNDSIAGVFTKGKLTYKNGDIYEGEWKDGLEEGVGKLTTKLETITGVWKRGVLNGIAKGTSKEDGFVTTYGYRDGILVSESLNPSKFTAQVIKLVENPTNKFSDILLEKNDTKYTVKGKLNGFADCFVKYYPPHISSTGKEKWLYQAETVDMTKEEALSLCSQLEVVFEKTKFSTVAKKEVEYNVATRRLVNYSFDGKLPIINVDCMGGDKYWRVTIRINK